MHHVILGTIPIRLRNEAYWPWSACPSTRSFPAAGRAVPAILANVDLPAPDGPITAGGACLALRQGDVIQQLLPVLNRQAYRAHLENTAGRVAGSGFVATNQGAARKR